MNETTADPFRCVVCGLRMAGGVWINGAGPYCPRCQPKRALPRDGERT